MNLTDFHDSWTWLFWIGTVGCPIGGALCIYLMHTTMPPKRRR